MENHRNIKEIQEIYRKPLKIYGKSKKYIIYYKYMCVYIYISIFLFLFLLVDRRSIQASSPLSPRLSALELFVVVRSSKIFGWSAILRAPDAWKSQICCTLNPHWTDGWRGLQLLCTDAVAATLAMQGDLLPTVGTAKTCSAAVRVEAAV